MFNLFKKNNSDKYTLFKSVDRQATSTKVTGKTGLDLYSISLYLNKGINKRAEKVGQTNFQLFSTRTGEQILQHPILNLLDRPNDFQTGDQFWTLASIYRDATGFCVIKKHTNNDNTPFKDGQKITSLEILNSAYITINYNEENTRIKSFTYTHPVSGMTEDVPYAQTIYWYRPDPLNDLKGVSLIQSGILSISSEQELARQYNSILRNGGSVDTLLSLEDVPSKEQLAQIKRDYRDVLEENKSTNMPVILGGKTNLTKIGLDPKQLQMLEAKGMLVDDIVALTGVPKAILGLTSGETFANANVAHTIFLRETIKPIIEDLVNVLDWRLLPDELELRYVDPTPEDIENNLKKAQTGHIIGALTLNEKRELLGLEPIDDGDEIQKPTEEETTPRQEEEKKNLFVHPLKNKDFRHAYHKRFLDKRGRQASKLKKELTTYFKEQEKRVINQLEGKKLLSADIFDTKLEISLMLPLLSTIKEIALEQGKETFDMFNVGFEFNYSSDLDRIIQDRFEFFSKKVNETTAQAVSDKVRLFNESDMTINQLKGELQSIYGDIKDYRIDAIVNTETSYIMNNTKGVAYDQIGITTKIWVWSEGIKGGVRDEHLSLDGEEVPRSIPFSNGMMHPHDPNASASETISCECTW